MSNAMASQPFRETLDIEEQLSRIRKMGVEQDKMLLESHKLVTEIQKITQDIKLATPQMFFQGALAMAALIGAGVALAKLAL